ncbi:MAG: Asp23/Gls24 family envelope stress response protein [Clostridiales bacterium]|nr:Asp23/Gls24 family envelope stress response protein [Clostridiales bacterium]
MGEKIETNYTAAIDVENPCGNVIIADDVIASIAGVAATEVEGVASMSGNITNEIVGKLGVKNLSKGVGVELTDEDVVSVKLTLNLRYGYSIPKTSLEVQEKVKAQVENMTGLKVSCVDIKIAGIELDKE